MVLRSGVSWQSSHVLAVSSFVFGEYAAINISWGSHDISVQGNHLASAGGDEWPGAAVNLASDGAQIEILDNTILSGQLPAPDSSRDVIVDGNKVLQAEP